VSSLLNLCSMSSFSFSVVAMSKKRGRPSKKTTKKENDAAFPRDVDTSASLESHSLFEDEAAELVVDHEDADLDLFEFLEPGGDLFADFGFCPPLLDVFSPSIVVKQNDLMLSILLSRDGAPAFISRAREIASAFEIDLNGRVWALVHHCGSASDSHDNSFRDSKVVSLGGVNQCLLGKSVASLGYAYGESLFQMLQTYQPGKCQIGTLHSNEIVVTSDDRSFPMRTRYVFYNEHGLPSFHFVVLCDQGLPVVGSLLLDDASPITHHINVGASMLEVMP